MSVIIHDATLPTGYSAITGGLRFNNILIEGDSGQVDTVIRWPYALWEGSVSYVKSEVETVDKYRFSKINNFFLNRQGAYGFLLEDKYDHTHDAQEATPMVEEINGVWRLTKRYPDVVEGVYYTRKITRPVEDSIVLTGGAAGGVLDPDTGIVTGIVAEGSWTGQFKVPCIFLEPKLERSVTPSGKVTLNVKLREVPL